MIFQQSPVISDFNEAISGNNFQQQIPLYPPPAVLPTVRPYRSTPKPYKIPILPTIQPDISPAFQTIRSHQSNVLPTIPQHHSTPRPTRSPYPRVEVSSLNTPVDKSLYSPFNEPFSSFIEPSTKPPFQTAPTSDRTFEYPNPGIVDKDAYTIVL